MRLPNGVVFQSTLPARGATPGTADDRRAAAISIHAPRTGSDTGARIRPRFSATFQSTLPARGATAQGYQINPATIFQSTLPARGATYQIKPGNPAENFNPRSPHGERRYHLLNLHSVFQFQSTLPARGATKADMSSLKPEAAISIHAPRTGSDCRSARQMAKRCNFNPRSPHGERQLFARARIIESIISIHAPRTGSDAGKQFR